MQALLIARLQAARAQAIQSRPSVSPALESRIQAMNGSGSPLPDSERTFFESRMGADFSGVRIHTDNNAVQTSRDINARAFTTGNNIAFNSGEYQPGTTAGRHLLAHELTHTVQQGGSAVLRQTEEEVPPSENLQSSEIVGSAKPGMIQRTGDIDAVLNALKTGSWDVDTLAAQLSDEQMATLSTANRVALIREIAEGYSVPNSDEQTILRLFRTTPAAERRALVGALDAEFLQRLESVLHGEEYGQYHVLMRRLFFGARSADEAVEQAESARTFPWADPGLIRAIWNVRFYYEIAEFTDQGRLRFVYWTNIAFMGIRNQAIEVAPMEMILVHFYDDETEAGASRGETMPMPAINLLSLVQSQFRGEIQTIADVALVGLGGAGLVAASTRVGRAVAALELAFGAADIVVRDFRAPIADSERGREFLAVWDVISTFIAIYGLARLATEGGRIFLRLRRVWRAFRGSDDAARLGNQLDPLQQQVDEVLERADEARTAQREAAAAPAPAAAAPAPAAAAPAAVAPAPAAAAPAHAPPAPVHVPGPVPRARVDVRPVPNLVRARSGVDVAINADRLDHVLNAHTVENFNPVNRVLELAGEALTHQTTFFRPGTVTNRRELYTFIEQALHGRAGRNIRAGTNNRLRFTLRNHPMEGWIGPVAGGGGNLRLNSIYPLASSGRNLTLAQIQAYAAEINAGTRTLDQIRAEIARLIN